PLRVVDVVETETALDAEAVLVRRPRRAVNPGDPVAADLVGDLAADAAIGADRTHLAVEIARIAVLVLVHDRGFHQRPGRAGLDAFAAGDAGGMPHRVVEMEEDLLVETAAGHADHVVDLDLAAGADAEVAVDAGIEIDAHRHVARVEEGHLLGRAGGEAAGGDPLEIGHRPEMARAVAGLLARGLVGEEELHHHLPRLGGAFALRPDHHAVLRLADAGGGQNALALDLDHAGAAVAVGPVARFVPVAKMRDGPAFALRDLP